MRDQPFFCGAASVVNDTIYYNKNKNSILFSCHALILIKEKNRNTLFVTLYNIRQKQKVEKNYK